MNQNKNMSDVSPYKYEVDLLDFLKNLWSKKLFIVLITFVCVLFTFYKLRYSSYFYYVQMEVLAVNTENKANPSSKIQGLSSLLSIAIPSSDSERNPKFNLYKTVITSNLISQILEKDTEFLKIIFIDGWDDEKQMWRKPRVTFKQTIKNYVKSLLLVPEIHWKGPNASMIKNQLDLIAVSSDTTNTVTTFSIETSDPDTWIKIFNKLHLVTEDLLRKREKNRIEENISFLILKLSKETQQFQRTSLIQTLTEQQKKLMMASSTLPYAAEKFGEITKSTYPTKPKPFISLVLSFFIGFMIGCVLVTFYSILKRFFLKAQSNS